MVASMTGSRLRGKKIEYLLLDSEYILLALEFILSNQS
jgi:hypothetical protein